MLQYLINFFKRYGVDANTTTTIFITIIVFGLGLIFTWIGGQIKTGSQRIAYKNSLLYILGDFSKACLNQTKVIKDSLKNVSLVKGTDFMVKNMPIGTLEYLNRIDLAVLIQNLRKPLLKRIIDKRSNYSKAISKLINIVYQIKVANETLPEALDKYFEISRNLEKDFYSNVYELTKVNDELWVKYGSMPPPREDINYVKGYFGIFESWEKNGAKTQIIHERNEIVLKILAHNQQFFGNSLAFQTNNFALLADAAFIDIEKTESFLVKLFETFAYSHRRASKVVDVIIKILD
jgi:hypothetical protein